MNIKIFMCTHKAVDFIPPLCVCVQGGAKINAPIQGALSDDGANGSISEKNPHYCELTVQYYAYKNEDCDYYGFCHYRRFFGAQNNKKTPYLTLGKPKAELIASENEIRALCDSYDVILPRSENVGMSVYEKYVSSPHHFKDDLDKFIDIIAENAPQLLPYAKEYLNGCEQYFCNMMIMRADIFKEYSALLFDLLEKFELQKTLHGYFEADRTNGYLAERFLGIYALYLKSKGVIIYHLPRVDAYCSFKKRFINKLLPPGSKLRLKIKRGVK